MNALLRPLVALVSGLLFGFGLALSGMLDPARVQGFLDPFGAWDPSLAFVLGGAVIISTAGHFVSGRMQSPAFDKAFDLPTRTNVDCPLVAGAAIFGLGWGLAGFCPGPALASLSLGLPQTFVFTAAMLLGMVAHDRIWRKRPRPLVGAAT